jgi:hypothetical protein
MRNNEDLNDLYSSPNIIWVIKSRMKWMGHVAHRRERIGEYRFLVEKAERKRPLGKP